jgi:hypothetical protein
MGNAGGCQQQGRYGVEAGVEAGGKAGRMQKTISGEAAPA